MTGTPRLHAALTGILGASQGMVDLDRADALAGDEHDRREVILAMKREHGIFIHQQEAASCETIADLLRLIATRLPRD